MDNPAYLTILQGMNTDIIIVGGGLNGPALALAAARAGFTVTIIDSLPVDRRKKPGFDGRSYALALASQRLLRGIGIWDQVTDNAQPMLEIKVTDGRSGEGPSPWMMHFDHAEIEEGPMGYMVEDRHLRRAFLDTMAKDDRITHLPGETVVAQTVDGTQVTVRLASGKSVIGAVLIGSDGRQSGTASRAGVKRTGWGYDQTAVVCAVAHEKPHNGIAHQLFMPGGPLAILPLTDNRSSIVWSEQADRVATLAAMNDDDFLDALRPAFGSFLGQITLAGARFTYPLGLTLANSLIADRIALIGDAAHGVHPIAGQGLNAGLRDVAALAEVLTDARARGEDIGSVQVLHRYQQWRRFDTTTLAIATDTFNRLFSNDNPLLRAARDIGMGLINAAPGLRRGFIREAAGLTGDLPKLMQG
ncbi:UbiH/UbiF/VisC/COQ6 family ubiquinone biosynthesis hydroxylase [Loktanella agnita]|uniref:UbiH/UbiF/VisC/COQ6 family ubiquinone biosynthesis hydroxylase n=1 Tax=Loktanella agnita TaxID=287097 RepID=UPI00398A19D9